MADPARAIRRYRWSFLSTLGVFFLFRLWFMGTLPLTGDESYHWEWSRHLALGYYDHPGFTAYFIWLSTTWLGGSTEFSVRLPALILLSGASLIVYLFTRQIVRERGGSEVEAERGGCVAGLMFVLLPLHAGLSMYMSTDPALVFFWSLSLFLFWRALKTESWLSWILAGLAYGGALQSKFLSFFLGLALGAFVLASRTHRRWLLKPQPYAAVVAALLVFAPFLYWNWKNGWATFMFNFVYRQEHGFQPFHLLEFLGSQAFLVLSPGMFVLVLWGFRHAWRRWRGGDDGAGLYLAMASAVPQAYFLWESLQQQIGLHWPLAGWTGILVFLAAEAGREPVWAALWRPRWPRRLTVATVAIGLVTTLAIPAILHFPVAWIRAMNISWTYSGDPNRISSEKHGERFGWREWGVWVESVAREMRGAQEAGEAGAGKGGVFLMADQYGLASNLAFYLPGQGPTHLWHAPRTCGENYRFWDRYDTFGGMDGILVSKSAHRLDSALPLLRKHFRNVGEVEALPVTEAGIVVRHFYLVRAWGFNGKPPVFK